MLNKDKITEVFLLLLIFFALSKQQ